MLETLKKWWLQYGGPGYPLIWLQAAVGIATIAITTFTSIDPKPVLAIGEMVAVLEGTRRVAPVPVDARGITSAGPWAPTEG